MQGKITKVLNMKPIEILSMIEEAAGTKTYDNKKESALAIIEKKNSKLNEIERVRNGHLLKQKIKFKNLGSKRRYNSSYSKVKR